MFQPQPTPFATCFYGVAGAASTPAPSQPDYGLLPLGLSPDGDGMAVVSGYGFAPSPAAAAPGRGRGGHILAPEPIAVAAPAPRRTASTVDGAGGLSLDPNLNLNGRRANGSPGGASGTAAATSGAGHFGNPDMDSNTLDLDLGGAGRPSQASTAAFAGHGHAAGGIRTLSDAGSSSNAPGKRPLDETDFASFDGAARLSSKESHHGRATAAAQLRQEQQQQQQQQQQQKKMGLLYAAAPSPVSLAHRIPRRTKQLQQQQQQQQQPHHLPELDPQQRPLMMLGHQARPGGAAPAAAAATATATSTGTGTHARPSAQVVPVPSPCAHRGASANAHAHTHAHAHAHPPGHHPHSHSHHPAAASPNHPLEPSPPSHSRSHLPPNPPLSRFVQTGSSSSNQQANLDFTHHHHKANTAAAAVANPGFSIPSPAGSASSSSNLHVAQATTGDPSSAHPYKTSGGHSNLVTPAASTPSNRPPTADMTGDGASDSVFQDDLVAQQRAAETYLPQLEGPVIGDRVSSEVITEEYAKADHFYVEKTINLPQTYSHFRPVQGDGNCGWRAIGFSYFEQLVLSGDPEKLQLEVARMTSLNNYLTTFGGYDLDLFEDMVLETITLLKDLAGVVPDTGTAMGLLMQRFNDRECSNAIVYHLRLLAGSWLKGNFTQYEPFLDTGGDVATWAHLNIEVPDKEIDHLSIILLTSILLKPIGFVLEIAYLDRSPGSEVNTYRFPDETNGQDPMSLGPIIYLLFRPDHYDILYKSPRQPVMPAPQPVPLNLQVNRAASFSHHHQITSHPPSLHSFATLDYSPLAMLPGFGGPAPGLTSMTTSSPASPMHNAYASTAQPWLQSPFSDTPMQQSIPPPPPPPQQQQQQPQPQPQPLAIGSTQAPSPSQSQLPAPGAPAKPNQPVDYQLRFSSRCYHLKNPAVDGSVLSQGVFPEPSFTTTMFKNSHFNKAHYNNPHFHPEEWTPEDETHDRGPGGMVKKKSKIKSEH